MKLPIILSSVFMGTMFFVKAPLSKENPVNNNVKKELTSTRRAILPVGKVSIIVDKSNYELTVYDAKGWFATYPCVFGNNDLADKQMEGDRRTPEGSFNILSKRVHDKWDRFMSISYPTKESFEKFRLRKQNGQIPSDARIGGSIGIHGTWPNDEYIIDRYKNWTMGCISLKNADVEDLYGYVPVGTQVTIKR
jgi:lipoprotein-anchoring transpeptidase ErfK/SrfK